MAQKTFAAPSKIKISSFIKKHKKYVLFQSLGGICFNLLSIGGAIILGMCVDAADELLNGTKGLKDFYLTISFFIGITITFQFCRFIKRFYLRKIDNLITSDMRAALLDAILTYPAEQFQFEKTGDLISRAIGDVEQVVQAIHTCLTETWDTILMIIATIVTLCFYSWQVTLIAIIPLPFAIALATFMRSRLYRASKKERQTASKINIYLQHIINDVTLLRLFGLEENNRDENYYREQLNKHARQNIAITTLRSGMSPIYVFIGSLGIIYILWMAPLLIADKTWTIGVFTTYFTMFLLLAIRCRVVARMINVWHGARASWERIKDKMNPFHKASTLSPIDESGLVVNNLSFSYKKQQILRDLSFNAKPGEIVAITGAIGSGKSTLANILSGLYQFEGQISLDGVDIRQSERQQIGFMDSKYFVFADTLRFNVSTGANEIDKAIRIAELNDDIADFAEGIETDLMEYGVRVSGGQRQRIALARAMATDARMIILDDPFSAIDVKMEEKIIDNIIKHNDKKQIIIIFSHRLKAFSRADKVLVLDEGKIIQSGTHQELINIPGKYRTLYQAQVLWEQLYEN